MVNLDVRIECMSGDVIADKAHQSMLIRWRRMACVGMSRL